MASIFRKRGSYQIAYFVNGKRKYLNTKLKDTKENRSKANKIKADIEREVESVAKSSEMNFVNLVSADRNITLEEAVALCITERVSGKSKNHLRNFRLAIMHLYVVTGKQTMLSDISSADIAGFINYLKEKKLANATVHSYIRYVKILFNFLVEEDYIFKSPFRKKLMPKVIHHAVIIFEDNDLIEILDEAKKRDNHYYNCLVLLLMTGLRPVDLLRLKIQDFDFKRMKINVSVSKTGKAFSFPIYEKLHNFLVQEMADELNKAGCAQLFPTFTVEVLGKRFRRIINYLGIGKSQKYNLKTFRKTFATRMAESGMGLLDVKNLLAHDTSKTTEKFYADVSTENLRKRINDLS